MKTRAISRNDHYAVAISDSNNVKNRHLPSSFPMGAGSSRRAVAAGFSFGAGDEPKAEAIGPGETVERPPSPGLVYSYVIDSDDDRRATVHRMVSGRPDMVARSYRDRDAFLAEADGLDDGCVIFFDDDAGHEDGRVAAAFIRSLRGSQRFACIMLATQQDIRAAIEAMKAGATDCLLYPCDAAEIMASVNEALDLVRETVRRSAALIEARQQIERLTSREQDVLHGLMQGKSNKMIALDLSISPRTVEIYRAHLMEKLGTHSLSETLKVAFAAGFS